MFGLPRAAMLSPTGHFSWNCPVTRDGSRSLWACTLGLAASCFAKGDLVGYFPLFLRHAIATPVPQHCPSQWALHTCPIPFLACPDSSWKPLWPRKSYFLSIQGPFSFLPFGFQLQVHTTSSLPATERNFSHCRTGGRALHFSLVSSKWLIRSRTVHGKLSIAPSSSANQSAVRTFLPIWQIWHLTQTNILLSGWS